MEVKDRPAGKNECQEKTNEIDNSPKVARSGRGRRPEQDDWLVDAAVYMSFCEGKWWTPVLDPIWGQGRHFVPSDFS